MISYKKLWKLLIDKDLGKYQMIKMAGLSPYTLNKLNHNENVNAETLAKMLMYGKEASNRKQEIDRQHYTIPNQRPKDKHCGKI